ncbi:hypothetical protein [Streptomyces sp. NPDC001135]
MAFDLLRLSGTRTTRWPYRRRRTALESVFAARRLSAPRVLCPSTTDPDTVRDWLTCASVGTEGVLCKQSPGPNCAAWPPGRTRRMPVTHRPRRQEEQGSTAESAGPVHNSRTLRCVR